MKDSFIIGKVYIIKDGNFGGVAYDNIKKIYVGSKMKCTDATPKYRFRFLEEEWDEKEVALREAHSIWSAGTRLCIVDVEAVLFEETEEPYIFP